MAGQHRLSGGYELGEEGPGRHYEHGSKMALQQGGWKYTWRSHGPAELYHIDEDPWEQRDLAGTGLAIEQQLDKALREEWRRIEGEGLPIPEGLGPAELEALRALGYVE